MGPDAASAVPAIATAVAATEALIANSAVNTLADIGTDGAAESLADLAMNTALDMNHRRSAIQALQRIDSELATAKLAEISTVLADEEGADELRATLS
jgi:HEAT repeat protein